MSATHTLERGRDSPDDFRHEAFLYSGLDEFVDGASSFIEHAVDDGDSVLVVVGAPKIDALRQRLGRRARHVHFADMEAVGRNPARIIPAWREFLDGSGSGARGVRGIGEPIWAGRSAAALAEAQRHEALLNVAFDATPAFWLLCPYDMASLDDYVVDHALRTHPFVLADGAHAMSLTYAHLDPFEGELPQPPTPPLALDFGPRTLHRVREFVAEHATRWGLGGRRVADVVVAVNELATNSIRHGGGQGVIRGWLEGDDVLFEVIDDGRIEHELVGRERPGIRQRGGRGLWIVNQLCDLVEIRSSVRGTRVRVRMALEP